jgi:uncharacterized lipoprotein
VLRAAVVSLSTAVLLAGCGGGPTDEQQVRDVLQRFATATEKRDYQTLCDDVFAPKLLSGLEQIGLPCVVAMKQSLGSVRNPRLTVGAVSVSGKTASAQVRTAAEGQQPSSDTIRLQKVKGDWRVASLGRAAAG